MSRRSWIERVGVLAAGAVAATGIWQATGEPGMAWLGFLLAALGAERVGTRAC